MDFHLKGIAIGVVFLVLQFIFFKKAKNKYIRLIPLFISLMCLFFCFLLYLGFPPIETTPFSSNEFTGALAMVWCGYAIFGALCVFMFTSIRKIIKIRQIKGKTKTATKTKRNKEEQIIIQEAENGNWSELSIKHIDNLYQ